MNKARSAIGGFCFGQKMIQPLQRDLPTVGIPAHLGCLCKAIDLPGLNENTARRKTIGAAFLIEPIHKAACRRIPAFPGPQRQGVVDHPKLQFRDDTVQIKPICAAVVSSSVIAFSGAPIPIAPA